MSPRTGLDGCGKSHPIGIRSPDRPAPSVVNILTELSRFQNTKYELGLLKFYITNHGRKIADNRF